MVDLRIVDAPEIPTNNITGQEKLPTGGNGNYSISLDSVADYTKTKKDLADNIAVDNKVNGVRQELDAHIEDLLNPHQVTKSQIGLGNVDNTADADKPVSNSTQAAIISAVAQKADKNYVNSQLSLKANKSDLSLKADTTYVDTALSAISTDASKQYATLALANADIANIALNQNVFVSEAVNGGYWYKATAGATSLTKSLYDPKLQAVLESRAYVDERITKTLTGNVHPIVVDPKGNSPLWLDDGRLGFTELEPSSQERVKLQMGLGNLEALNIVPIVVDSNGNCPLWIQEGLLNFAGIHANAVQLIKEQFGAIDSQKTNNVTSATYPIISDGTSLRQWKAKASKLKSGLTQQLRVIVTGDSWAEHETITNELTVMLREAFGFSGSGWINVAPENNQLDGISVSKSGGWTLQDLNSVPTFTHGTSADGFTLFSSTAGSTITASNITNAQTVTIFYGKTAGSFSYSINGAAEVTVTVDSSGAAQQSTSFTVSGTSNVVIKVISGTVAIFGFHARKTGNGVEVTKLGNGSCTGKDYSKISPTAQVGIGGYLSPDVVVIMLGTNDYRISGNTVETYKAGINAIIDGYRTNNPNCGFILIAPADSNATHVVPLSNYHDAIYVLAKDKQVEFYNMYDDWDVWSVENNNGQWADSLHVSKSGAYRIAKKLFKNFLES